MDLQVPEAGLMCRLEGNINILTEWLAAALLVKAGEPVEPSPHERVKGCLNSWDNF